MNLWNWASGPCIYMIPFCLTHKPVRHEDRWSESVGGKGSTPSITGGIYGIIGCRRWRCKSDSYSPLWESRGRDITLIPNLCAIMFLSLSNTRTTWMSLFDPNGNNPLGAFIYYVSQFFDLFYHAPYSFKIFFFIINIFINVVIYINVSIGTML